jgi:hypothetical protein
LVKLSRRTVFERGSNGREDVLRLTGQHMVRFRPDRIRIAARPGSADNSSPAESPGTVQNFDGVKTLGMHRTDHDQIGPQQIIVRQGFECAIDQPDIPRAGTQRGHRDQA